MMKNLIFSLAALGFAASASAQEPPPNLSTPPPAPDVLTMDGCSISQSAIRAKYPALSEFLVVTGFESPERGFGGAKEAIKFYLEEGRQQLAEAKERRKALKDGVNLDDDSADRRAAREERRAARQAQKEDRAAFRAQRQALRKDIRAFRKEYGEANECRQVAWWALGANVASESAIDANTTALEAEDDV